MKQDQTNNVSVLIKNQDDPLGVKLIAEAKDKTELIQAFENAHLSFQELYDNFALQELQDIAKEMEAKSGGKNLTQKYIDKYQEAVLINGVINGKVVEGSVNDWHQKHVIKLRNQIVAEYQANSPSEFMIVDLAINAYFRSLHTSRIYSCLARDKDGTVNYTQLKINMMKELGKQVEGANRQFISALTLLKEMKRPPINIKVQSKQAFVGQNQQFNKNA